MRCSSTKYCCGWTCVISVTHVSGIPATGLTL
ncbi:hypothetical protein F3J22_02110 [Chitinophaga sp. Cy-1792]|nr:hypothetical protein [Chitinophaga sp. Cy-1792]